MIVIVLKCIYVISLLWDKFFCIESCQSECKNVGYLYDIRYIKGIVVFLHPIKIIVLIFKNIHEDNNSISLLLH